MNFFFFNCSALQDLEPGQLLLFVQSFGIPVQSMSRLLQCLDTAVEDDPEGMENSVVDKVKVHSHVMPTFAFFFAVPFLKMQMLGVNTITCCHRAHS